MVRGRITFHHMDHQELLSKGTNLGLSTDEDMPGGHESYSVQWPVQRALNVEAITAGRYAGVLVYMARCL